jgi:hypothetical protein
MHYAQSGAPPDRADPAMSGTPVEPLTILAAQDRALVTLANREVDRAGRPRHERDHRGLVALAHDRQGPVTALDSQILDVPPARLGHP